MRPRTVGVEAGMRMVKGGWVTTALLAVVVGCGGGGDPDAGTGADAAADAGADAAVDAAADAEVDAGRDAEVSPACEDDAVCDDGTFCNGSERCDPEAAGADDGGCVTGSNPCVEGEVCLELEERCVLAECVEPDDDGDGYDDVACGGDDCDDLDADRHPGHAEDCDGVDNDCDGEVDTGCACVDGETRPCGSDVGACSMGTQTCAEGVWGDCVGDIEPTDEVCNGLDDDCDGETDDGVETEFYRDADGDGYGGAGDVATGCTAPDGYVSDGTDCDDGRSTVNPGAEELCDGLDTDCSEGGGVRTVEDDDGDHHAPEGTTECSGGWPADDCRDSNADVYPGQDRYFSEGYCTLYDVRTGRCLTWGWDYDCDGTATPQPASEGCVYDPVRRVCRGSGPVYSGDPPACGADVSYLSCYMSPMGCTSSMETRGLPCR